MLNEKSNETLTIKQAGLLLVVIEDFNIHRLNRLKTLEIKADNGEIFSDVDVAFMKESIDGALSILTKVISHKELHGFCAHLASLYNELTRKALKNEIRTNN